MSLAILEDLLRAPEVDAVALVPPRGEVGDGGHVHHRVGVVLPDDVLRLGLANVGLDEADAGRALRPRPAIDARDLMAAGEQL
jgi:hypothetical protein